MGDRPAAVTATIAVGVASGVAAAGLGASYAGEHTAEGLRWLALGPTPFLVAGVVAAVLRPEHPQARRLLTAGALFELATLIEFVVNIAQDRRGVVSWLWAGLVAFQVLEMAQVVVLCWLFALLPDGRVRAPSERFLLRAAMIVVPVPVLVAVTHPTLPIDESSFEHAVVASPIAVAWLEPTAPFVDALGALGPVAVIAALVLAVRRYRRLGDEARVQVKWVLLALLLSLIAGLASLLLRATDVLPASASSSLASWILWTPTMLIPVAIVISIVRHHLFDVDLVIRRTAVFTALWSFIAGVYLAITAALGLASADRLPAAAVVVITMAATLALQPLRARLNRVASRRVFGSRPTRQQLLATVGETLEHALELDQLGPRVAETVRRGIGLEWVRLELQLSPTTAGLAETIGTAGAPADDARPSRVVPLAAAGETVGTLHCGPKLDRDLDDSDRELLDTIARQVALGIRNARLAAELSARLGEIERQTAELTASRARLVAAQDSERRRIERDLHDGVQQQLIAISTRLRLARNQIGRDDLSSGDTLAGVHDDIRSAIDELRRLVHGIYPTVLTDSGLLAAVEDQASKIDIAVAIDADQRLRHQRLPQDVEVASYFLVTEALTNVVKHAGVDRAEVLLRLDGDTLAVTVRDLGTGFVPADTSTTGLAGIRDRVEAAGGRVRINSRPGQGTTIAGELPTVAGSTLVG